MIVPEIAGGAASELDDLRAACEAAIGRLLAAQPRFLVVLGSGPTTTQYFYPLRGSFTPWGLPLEFQVGVGTASGPPLPLSLTIGAWLLHRVGSRGMLCAEAIAGDAPVDACVAIGTRYAQRPAPVALLAMGDGSMAHDPAAPRYADPRAAAYDRAVARALATADVDALLGLDPAVSLELQVAGRAPWQVLAGAAQASGGDWRADLHYDAAPYGVTYFVATWERT